MNKKNINIKKIGIVISICALFFAGIIYAGQTRNEYMTYINFNESIERNEVENVELTSGFNIYFTLKDNDTRYMTDNPRSIDLKERLLGKGIEVSEASGSTSLGNLIIILIIGGAIYYFYKNKNKAFEKQAICEVNNDKINEQNKISFLSVAGNDEAKENLSDVVDFLKNPEKYSKYGARMPKGIIFYGPPGTGKTLMAKALASEADAAFFSANGSDFVQMYVGVGASRIRSLFKSAKEKGKAVIFIDEIDALAKKRSSNMQGNDERDQTLNALLTEMSGFNDNAGVIVIAATNRIDMLDEALLRPGRFDRQIEIGLPDKKARYEILKVHSKNKPIDEEVDLNSLASETVYFSGAMLENLLNEAAIFAARDNSLSISKEYVNKAYYEVIAGAEKKDRSSISIEDKKITAYHEAGHVIATKVFRPENKVSKVSIIPSTKGAGGFTMNIPKDKLYNTKSDLINEVKILLAGRAAEEVIFGKDNITTGASNDIKRATEILNSYIKKYGMSDKYGMINLENSEIDITDEMMNKLAENYKMAKELLINKKQTLTKLAEKLITKETLNETEIDTIINNSKEKINNIK